MLCIGTAVLDLSFRNIVRHSLHRDARIALTAQQKAIALHILHRDLLLASLISLVLATLVSAWVAGRTSRRLRHIVDFASRIASGDFTARIQEDNSDEIGEVARALDATAGRLEASFQALESKQRELAALLDSMQEAVIAVDAAGQVSWSNAVMQRIAPGAVRAGKALVVSLRDPDVLRCVEIALKERRFASGKAISAQPGRVYEIGAAPTPDGGAVAVLHDVTEIERAEKMRSDFVANVSHELRTPLTSISGYVETLLDDDMELTETAREFMGIILKNARRVNRLTEDLLALAQVESGQRRPRRQAVRASVLVTDALESLAGMTMESGIALEAGETTDAMVLADVDAMTQVFGNLIENAIKYGGSGGRVVVGARKLAGLVEFYVQDFGPGMASEHLDRIFERFYRVDKARSRQSGGTGLGLAIVKHIVLAHRGEVRAESELGAGSTFLFTLPLVPLAGDADQQTATAAVL